MTQIAVVVPEIGHPLIPVPENIPIPGENEILVKVASAGINPYNQVSRDTGLFISETLPAALFQDISGTVHAVNPIQPHGVVGFECGDRVFGQATFTGLGPGSREYCILQTPFAAKIPDGVGFDEAASLTGNAVAAAVALWHESGLGLWAPFEFEYVRDEEEEFEEEAEGGEKGENGGKGGVGAVASGDITGGGARDRYKDDAIVIVGGGSQVGKCLVQFARLTGFGTVIAVAHPRNKAELRTLGATHVVDRFDREVVGAVREIVGDELVYGVDTVHSGDGGFDLVASSLSNTKKGTFASLLYGGVSEKIEMGKEEGVEGRFAFGSSHRWPEFSQGFWKALPGWIEKKEVLPLAGEGVVEGLDAAKLNELLDGYRDGKLGGKWYLHP